jgi:hypothetical protein
MRSFDPPRSAAADRKPAGRPQRPLVGARPAQAPRQFSGGAGARREASAPAPAASGLPERLRTVMEAMSGFSLADVVVHRNSAEPARLGAAAFTKGEQIHLAPGQERHLPHEAWHVVQQAQGRVVPTLQMKSGIPINDDAGLEREADAMGGRAAAAAARAEAPAAAPAAMRRPSRASGPIQGYFQASNGVRLSDGNQLALAGPQALWATREAIDEANGVLGKKHSYVKFVTTGASMESIFGVTQLRVEPKWNDKIDVKIKESERLKIANATYSGFTTHADCFMNSQVVMGVEDTDTGDFDQVSPVFGKDDQRKTHKPEKAKEKAGPGSYLSTNLATRSLQLFLSTSIPEFLKYLALVPKESGISGLATEFLSAKEPISFNGYLLTYRNMSTKPKYAPLLDLFSRQFGVNEYMTPQIGEGLAVITDPFLKNKRLEDIDRNEVASDRTMWNYHFAGVVMRDGKDYVILENYSVEDPTQDNQQWSYEMFGVADQSFHAEMSRKKNVEGGGPLSMSFDRTK